jgi:GAF domain-containing protein
MLFDCMQEPFTRAARRLCQDLAAAVVSRPELPPDVAAALAALPAQPTAVSLGLAEGEGPWLLHIPVMHRGRVVWSSAVEAHGALQEGTAAWQSYRGGASLAWSRSKGGAPGFSDWRSLLASNPEARALLTAPLAAGGGASYALGALTLALRVEPSPADVAALRQLADWLAGAVVHHTKSVWEVSDNQEPLQRTWWDLRTAQDLSFCRRLRPSYSASPRLCASPSPSPPTINRRSLWASCSRSSPAASHVA